MRRGLLITAAAALLGTGIPAGLLGTGIPVASAAVPAASVSTKWSIQPTPLPTGANDGPLNGVSCIAAANCTAVGAFGTRISGKGELNSPMAERWNGSTWSVQPMPSPSGSTGVSLTGVSCAAADSCTATGEYTTGSGTRTQILPLAEHWDGSAWAAQPMPLPAGVTISNLYGVSCASDRGCTAVGSYFNSANVQVPLAESWDGSTWTVQAVPSRSKSGGEILAVSCAAPGRCTAVGNYFGHTPSGGLLVDRSSAGAWRAQSIQPPTGAQGAELGGISCFAAASCTAVGDYTTLSGSTQTTHPLAENWDGSTWTVQTVPAPPGPGLTAALGGVSCFSRSNCTAVGIYFTQSIGVVAVAYHGLNGTWQLEATARPARAKVLAGVSCTTATTCTAVGWYRQSLYQPLAEQR